MRLLIAGLLMFASACTPLAERIDRRAMGHGLSRQTIDGAGFRHIVYSTPASPSTNASSPLPGTLVVFIDGDGRPWTADGQSPSPDPTTRDPLALELLARTPASSAYLTRPCYQSLHDDRCSSKVWTHQRFSPEVVASMAVAIRRTAEKADARDLVLVGYSGGGVLAVLIAERIENVRTVITIAANLDTDAWTQHHGYLPLMGSLNPALSEREHPWPEFHLAGTRDRIVPITTTTAYFKRFPSARQWTFDEHDHNCCWVRNWPSLFARIRKEID